MFPVLPHDGFQGYEEKTWFSSCKSLRKIDISLKGLDKKIRKR